MSSRAERSPEELSAKRRQDYWKRRRTVQRMTQKGSGLAVDRMRSNDLSGLVIVHLMAVLQILEDGSSPTIYHHARAAWDCLNELIDRGEQLRMF